MGSVDKAVIEALRATIELNRDRLVRTLKPHEISCVSYEAVGAFVIARENAELLAELEDYGPPKELGI